MSALRAFAAAMLVATSGCAALGVIDDGSSVSWGRASDGGITNPVRLPDEGDGYRVPSRWATRGLRYGTQELVDMIISTARRVEMDWPGSRLTVADLSWERGGPSAWHRSHQSGRDVDLVFYVTDEAGRPVEPELMLHFGKDGRSTDKDQPIQVFDTARNWSLVRALCEYQGASISRIFIYEPLKEMLLDHARAIGEPEWVLDRAGMLLVQPMDSAPHDDHMHVRILCPVDDQPFGCEDYGRFVLPPKKLEKAGMMMWTTWSNPLRDAMRQQLPAMFSLAGFPLSR
jgi:penicillin-insensitive murein endopeptidase